MNSQVGDPDASLHCARVVLRLDLPKRLVDRWQLLGVDINSKKNPWVSAYLWAAKKWNPVLVGGGDKEKQEQSGRKGPIESLGIKMVLS